MEGKYLKSILNTYSAVTLVMAKSLEISKSQISRHPTTGYKNHGGGSGMLLSQIMSQKSPKNEARTMR